MTERNFGLRPIIAIQVIVPMIVEKMVARDAIESVFTRAEATALSEKSLMYQLSVNPPHLALDLLKLKESTISVTMGAYMNKSMIPR